MAEFAFGFGVDRKKHIAADLTELIGNTPLLELSRFGEKRGCTGKLVAKLEYFNPLGSSKDRAALSMVEAAERTGALKPGGCIIEPTSGNTGIGLAFVAALKGYPLTLTMPENMSEERKKLLRMLGAELVLTPAAEGMDGAVKKAEELAAERGNAYIPNQFANPANADAHRKTTAAEILRDTYGKVDVFVAGVGTGGTITGVGEVLKAYNPLVKIVAVEPQESPMLSEGHSGSHGIQGIGANFVPALLNREILDEVFPVTTEQALSAAREAAKTEGLLVGISSGAALHAAAEIAKRPKMRGKQIVVLLPDGGERYLSTALFD